MAFDFRSAASSVSLLEGDCLELLAAMPARSVDAVIADPPYGTTACKWDAVIPFEPMWAALSRVVRGNGPVVFTASQPFTSALVMSNPKKFRHSWVWDKKFAANVMQAKRQPLKTVEDVLVFSLGAKGPAYYPQMTRREKPIKAGGSGAGSAIPNQSSEAAREAWRQKVYDEKYPTSILPFNVREGRGLHPTQKPLGLMEYLVRTYTQPGETVLDFTMGSGTTGVACVNSGRRFLGIEKDPGHFRAAAARLEDAEVERMLR